MCYWNCYLRKDPSKPVGLSVQIRDEFMKIASYRWILSSCDEEGLNCTSTLYDESDNYTKVLFYNSLEEGKNYAVEVWIYCDDKEPKYLNQFFQTTKLPVMGNCNITSPTGFTQLSKFEISCTGFTNPDGTALTYSLYIFDHKMKCDVLVISNMNPNQTFFTLYPGYLGDTLMVNVTIRVSNKYKATIFWKQSMMIFYQSIPQKSENIFFSDAETKLGDLWERLNRLISLDPSSDLTQFLLDTKQVLREIDMRTGLDSSHPKMKHIIKLIISILKKIDADITELMVMADIAQDLTESQKQMTTAMKNDVKSVLLDIYRKFTIDWYKASSQEAKDLSSFLISGVSALFSGERSENEGSMTALEHYQLASKLFHEVNSVLDLLMNFEMPHQPPLTINTKFLSVTGMKLLRHELANLRVTQTSILKGRNITGSIHLPENIPSLQNISMHAEIILKVKYQNI